VRTLEHFRKYLYGQEFHLHTDHSALTWFMSCKNLEVQNAHWIQQLTRTQLPITIKAEGNNSDAFHDSHAKNECTYYHKFEAWADIKQVQATAAVAAAG
jgi:hypothetical protein